MGLGVGEDGKMHIRILLFKGSSERGKKGDGGDWIFCDVCLSSRNEFVY